MSKGKVFIAWSGNKEIAEAVSAELEKNGYDGVVGGRGGREGGDLFVGETVMKEISASNQAIFLISKTDKPSISGNVLFELGYALARFNPRLDNKKQRKIHVFYINIKHHDSMIPSDLNGIWAEEIEGDDSTGIVDSIVQSFRAHQKSIIPENKMKVIDSHYEWSEAIKNFMGAPRCSEYEMAQYILFHAQSGYMFHCEKETRDNVKALQEKYNGDSVELKLSMDYAISYLGLFEKIVKDGNIQYLEWNDFQMLTRRIDSICRKIEGWERNDFSYWFLVFLYDFLNYIHVLVSFNPKCEQRRTHILTKSIGYAENCLKYCEELLKSQENEQCVWLYKAYMYRNLSTAYGFLDELEKKIENLYLSLSERAALYDMYDEYNINSKLFENFELEYYLALSESLAYEEDEWERDCNKESCEEYISRVDSMHREKNFFVNKIHNIISNV